MDPTAATPEPCPTLLPFGLNGAVWSGLQPDPETSPMERLRVRGSSSNGVLLLGPREGIDFALAATWGTLLDTFVSVVWTA